MVIREPRIRDLDWANVWERDLEPRRRARIKRAIRHGEALDDRVDAALAAEYARRQMRPLWIQLPLNAALLAVFSPVMLADWQAFRAGDNVVPWFTVVWAVVAAAVAIGVVVFLRGRRARRLNLPDADFDAMNGMIDQSRRRHRSSEEHHVR